MPEGDTIHHAANRIRPVIVGHVPDRLQTPHPRLRPDRWPQRLAGRAVERVDARGKHLLLRFEGGLTIHSHLRMTGAWHVFPVGAKWRRNPRRAWLVMRHDGQQVVQFDGPVLELMTDSRTRIDQRIAGLGPDCVAPEPFDEALYLRRLREDDPTRPIGDTLLDQTIVAGMGTVWRSEACWQAAVNPWRPAGEVGDDDALALVREVRPRMQQSALEGFQSRRLQAYGRAGLLCHRCGAKILRRGQGDNDRLLYWCPGCQT